MLLAISKLPFSAKIHSHSRPPAKQSSVREREYLRPSEVNAIIRAARQIGRHGTRDATMILLMFRHGLRTAELVALKWLQLDLVGGYIEVRRANIKVPESKRRHWVSEAKKQGTSLTAVIIESLNNRFGDS